MNLRQKMQEFYKIFQQGNYDNSMNTNSALADLISQATNKEEEAIMLECINGLIKLKEQHKLATEEKAQTVNQVTVKNSLNILTHSERKILAGILCAFGEKNEGIIVVSQIADEYRLSHSVAVNSLRKLTSAKVIVTHSLGMRGTFIKIINSEIRKVI